MKPKFQEIEIPGLPEKHMPKFLTYFVYTPKGNFLLKGQNDSAIMAFIERFPVCIYRWVAWQKGESRGGWMGIFPGGWILIHKHKDGFKWTNKTRVEFKQWSSREAPLRKVFTYRRMPNKWLSVWSMAIASLE